ncbi:MAG: Rieske (2Fe-2S) protein [Bacteroidia bacterium]|nr:Rieske (2Fe-2S) protein [Bacteroidia bacterium]NND52815.1 Rieske (2Fe-2S) protein [Flavobacteriaceae bacterium]
MERRKFIKNCCYTAIGLPVLATVLESCGSIYYASTIRKESQIVLAKSEFIKGDSQSSRSFVLIKDKASEFPICIYKSDSNHYVASLLECTHQSCELNVGGGVYSCPCHGSEFTMTGKLLEGPAETDLKTFKIDTDNENIYINLY